MKQVLQNFKTGELKVEDIPAPILKPGGVLVRNHYSLISTGTEGGTVKLGKMSMLGKARARPEQVKKVLQVAKAEGVRAAFNATMRTLDIPIPLGYCCAGEIIDVGAGVTDLERGQMVACGGGFANHADVVSVSRNLCAPLPEGLDPRHAAFCTLGSIAMQGVRTGQVSLGENVVVIGLGLVGLLTADLLKAAGCRVLGIDTSEARVAFARQHDYCKGIVRSAANLEKVVSDFTTGNGADSVIITAAAPNSNDPVALAGEIARFRARIVVVGRTEMKAPRETYLFKELQLCTSMAYGPGTGDPSYEENGIDYPIGLVRWTENRNMGAILELAAAKKLNLEPLITHEMSIDDAAKAFDLITGKIEDESKMPIGVLLSYPVDSTTDGSAEKVPLKVVSASVSKPKSGVLKLGVIGAGSYATNFMLPVLSKLKGVEFHTIVSASGVRAQALGKKYGFEQCVSDARALFKETEIDCVFILSRHDSHAPFTIAALEAGKHVFVEKPMAMTFEELEEIKKAKEASGKNVMVGFNRRYARLALRLKEFFNDRVQPMSVQYRANVGYRPPSHWLHDPVQGGGVIIGEACHHIDFCCWLVGENPVEVTATRLGASAGLIPEDNVYITIRFAEGSLAHVAYLANGSVSHTRERVEVFADSNSAELVDFKELRLVPGRGGSKRIKDRIAIDKGFEREVSVFTEAIRRGKLLDELFGQQFASSRATIEAARQIHEMVEGALEKE